MLSKNFVMGFHPLVGNVGFVCRISIQLCATRTSSFGGIFPTSVLSPCFLPNTRLSKLGKDNSGITCRSFPSLLALALSFVRTLSPLPFFLSYIAHFEGLLAAQDYCLRGMLLLPGRVDISMIKIAVALATMHDYR